MFIWCNLPHVRSEPLLTPAGRVRVQAPAVLVLVESLACRPRPDYVLDAAWLERTYTLSAHKVERVHGFEPSAAKRSFASRRRGTLCASIPREFGPNSLTRVGVGNGCCDRLSDLSRHFDALATAPAICCSFRFSRETNSRHSHHKCQQPFATLFPTCLNGTLPVRCHANN